MREAPRLRTAHPALGLVAAAVLAGCASAPDGQGRTPQDRGTARSCEPRTKPVSAAATAASAVEPPPSPEDYRAASARLSAAGFSPAAIEIADVIGALPRLRELVRLEAEAPRSIQAETRLLRVRQNIMDRVMLAMLDVSSILAEIDCEGERGDHLRGRLQRIENRRTRRLSLATIMVGALTAAVSGGLGLAGAAGGDLAAIVGGSTEASVAGTLLLGPTSGELLQTRRNLLRDVWEGPAASALFPRSVWRFLNRRPDGDADRPTVAENLRAEWRSDGRLGPPGSPEERDRIALLFGYGGTYTIDELELRDATLDLLEASVALMSQDLRVLLEELVARSARAVPPPTQRPKKWLYATAWLAS